MEIARLLFGVEKSTENWPAKHPILVRIPEKVIAKKKAEIAENKYLDKQKEPDPIKFHEFGKEYLQWAKANKKPSSWNRELSTMRRLDKEFGEKILQEITTWQIEKWKARRKESVKRPDAGISSFKKQEKEEFEKNPKTKAAIPSNPCSSQFDLGFPTSASFNARSVSSFSFSKAIR